MSDEYEIGIPDENIVFNNKPSYYHLAPLPPLTVSSLAEQLQKVKGFSSSEEVDNFLKNVDVNKDNALRYLAYLYKTNILTGFENVGNSLAQLIADYYSAVNRIYGDEEYPLEPLKPMREDIIIEKDIPRSFPYFCVTCQSLGIKEENFKDRDYCAKRLLAMASLSDNDTLSYTQGFDRWMFNAYALALYFCQFYELDIDFAEALASQLTQKLLYIVGINEILKHPTEYEPFDIIDAKIYKVRQDIADILCLQTGSSNSLLYSLKWRLIFFADDFESKNVLVVWDQLLLHQDDIDHFFFSLVMAQIKEVNLTDSSLIAELIQNQKANDMNQFFKDVYEIYNNPDLYIINEEDEKEAERQKQRVIENRQKQAELIQRRLMEQQQKEQPHEEEPPQEEEEEEVKEQNLIQTIKENAVPITLTAVLLGTLIVGGIYFYRRRSQ